MCEGAILKLNYAGTDIVSGLALDGIEKANGIYDGTNTSRLIIGTGKIQVGPLASYFAWVAANAPGQAMDHDHDHDHDGVPNGVEYFMGKTGNGFTANPGIMDGTVRWPKIPNFNGSYSVETSTDLSIWTDVSNDPAQVSKHFDSVVWTRNAGPGSRFVRLHVTPN